MWHREARWRNRLLVEQALMAERFPQFVLTQDTSGLLVWRGILEPIEGARYVVTATMPRNYPFAAPQLRVEEPPLRSGVAHLYSDNTLCIHKRNWEAMRGTVASIIPLASAWLVAYTHWLATGENF